MRHDTFTKFNKYLQAGVLEYWIVDPEDKKVYVHILDDDKYISKIYGEEDVVAVHALAGCVMNMDEVFTDA
jgi:Uma2 family endonuclease